MKIKTLLFITLLIMSPVLSGCKNTKEAVSKSGLYFDTVVTVSIYSPSAKEADKLLNDCMQLCDRYGKLYDENDPESDIAKINNSVGAPVKVDADTVALIEDSLKYSEKTGGLFDITIDPVSDLWDFHEEAGSVPDKKSLDQALSHVGYTNISIDKAGSSVTLSDGSIDPGAVAKGYIADRIAEYLEASPYVNGAIINMGGDLRLIGSKGDNGAFNIGINDPFSDSGIAADLYITDRAVATSGTYERCFRVGGRRYHHILDPATGYPADTDIESVTVITGNAVDADCLCTVCILLGSDEAIRLIENTADTEAYLILSDGSVRSSSGVFSYIRQ